MAEEPAEVKEGVDRKPSIGRCWAGSPRTSHPWQRPRAVEVLLRIEEVYVWVGVT